MKLRQAFSFSPCACLSQGGDASACSVCKLDVGCLMVAVHGVQVVDVQTTGKHKVLFDQGVCEWLSLAGGSQWSWLTPRGVSAGLTPALCTALRKLGCGNVVPEPQPPAATPPGVVPAPGPASAEAAVGRQLWLWCAASGRWHEGLVIALSQAGTGAHHVVYLDGAAEWVMLSHEAVVWKADEGKDKRLRHICPPSLSGAPQSTWYWYSAPRVRSAWGVPDASMGGASGALNGHTARVVPER